MLEVQKRDFFRLLLAMAAVAVCLLAAAPARAAGPESAAEPHAGTELVLRALSLLGVNYKFGGSSPDTGLDCSGMVRHVFRETIGMVLPRSSEEMSKASETIDATQLRPGDLVFFNTLRRTFSHVGIYIGNNQFVHSATRGGGVRIEQMNASYWSQRFNGARRVLTESLGIENAGAARLPASSSARPAQPSGQTLPLTGAPLPRGFANEFGPGTHRPIN